MTFKHRIQLQLLLFLLCNSFLYVRTFQQKRRMSLDDTVSHYFDCGGELRQSTGIITSPDYNEDHYPDSTECKWTILLPDERKHIKITFLDFKMEPSEKCTYDYLAIFEGRGHGSELIGRYCGDEKPAVIKSKDNIIQIKFVADSSVHAKGFKLKYEATSGCDETFRKRSGFIHSPLHPGEYPSDIACLYNIIVPRRHKVKLNFTFMDLEDATSLEDDGGINCKYDYVELFDGPKLSSSSLGRYCGKKIPSVILSSGNNMLIKFKSDQSVGGNGFRATFQATRLQRCSVENGGCQHKCKDRPNNRVCSCNSGYKLLSDGRTCEDINECTVNNGGCPGKCINTNGSFQCGCGRGFEVKLDDVKCSDIDECAAKNGGCNQTCNNIFGSYYCTCHPGYEMAPDRRNCTDIDECERGQSHHHCNQMCQNTPGSYYCSCRKGYELSANGRICKDVNECLLGGVKCEPKTQNCTNLPGSYRCDCLVGLKPDPKSTNKCNDIDECAEGVPNCHNCINAVGSYYCECHKGYRSNKEKSTCLDINECENQNGGCLQRCVNLPGTHKCMCFDGFKAMDPKNNTCADIDECAENNGKGPCDHICTNGRGSFNCSCQVGFTLANDGVTCQDNDECAMNNGGCVQNCVNLPGNYSCQCYEGHREISHNNCTDIDECKEKIDTCDKLAKCVNLVGKYECVCPSGFTKNGRKCEDIDECVDDFPHGCHHNCNNTFGSYNCYCNPGYLMDENQTCSDIDECLSVRPCQHSEFCVNSPGKFACGCRDGYQLANDSKSCLDVDECSFENANCEQICVNFNGSHNCECRPGFQLNSDNRTCQDINECETNSSCCEQNCNNLDGDYQCGCRQGYSLHKDHCTCKDIDECKNDDGGCQHICTNTPGHYRCECRPGYKISLIDPTACEDVNECEKNNGGCEQQCLNNIGSYNCSCGSAFTLKQDQKSCKNCPTCSDFESMARLVASLQLQIKKLQDFQATLANGRCLYKGKTYSSDESWDETEKRSCLCRLGQIICTETQRCKQPCILPAKDTPPVFQINRK